MIRIAIACETQFHLLNAINYAYNQLPSNASIDLYILEDRAITEDMIKRINQINLFNKVYVYQYKKNDLAYEKFHVIKDKISRVLFLNSYINNRLKNGKVICDYDYIFVSIVTKFIFGLISLNKKAKIVYYDDGLGTYINNYDYNMYRRSSKIYRIMGRNVNYLSPIKLYVNNKKFCKKTITSNIKEFYPLKRADEKFWKILFFVFGIDDMDLYKKNRIIYLSMPNDCRNAKFTELTGQISNDLKKYSCVIRPHPRDDFDFSFSDLVDNSQIMWEMISAKQITDEHILISVFSTAQMTPKMLYNKEPELIFLYKLYKGVFPESQFQKFEELLGILKENYNDKKKLHVIDSMQELEEILNKK